MSILTAAAANTAMRAAHAGAFGSRIDRHMSAGVDEEGRGSILEQEFTPCSTFAEIIEMGSWPVDPDGPCLPLRWLVIGKRADGAKLAITLDSIECRGAHDFDGDINWQHSSLRFWLHSTFLPYALSPEEAERLELVSLVTYDNPVFKTIGCALTYDRIFNLSESEALHFFGTDQARGADATPYASRHASVRAWWLRSPGGRQFAMEFVNHLGAIDHNGFHASLDCVGVRPAVVIAPDNGKKALEEKREHAQFFGVHRTDSPGYAIAYNDEKNALAQLARSRNNLTKADARTAVSGGKPSIDLIHRLLNRGAICTTGCWHLALAAIPVKELTLFKRLASEGNFRESETTQLLNDCVSAGALDFACALTELGVDGAGYAKAYLPSTLSEETAICAVTIDPTGAYDQWSHVGKFPLATRAFIRACAKDVEKLAALPGILSVCASHNFLSEARLLLENPTPALTHEVLAQAIQEASAKDYNEMVALLVDRQAMLFGTKPLATAYRGPVLEL